MFDNLKKAFSNASTGFSEKDLNEKDIEDVLFELEINLLESDVATEVIDSIKDSLKEKIIGSRVEKKNIQNFVKQSLIEFISETFDNAGHVDLVARINEKKSSNEPFIVVFVGINGTGKTTSLAKVANILKNEKLSVVIAAADTYRAGAIEQLREHTNRLNLKIIAQNYGSDPAAVAKDAVLYAKSHKVDCVLVDTAGRMQTSSNLMEQIAKITKVVKPDMKIFVGDSLAGNDTVNQAREFHKQVNFECSILTKSDADARGGAALSIVNVTSSPIIYVGVGQEYDDIVKFSKQTFLENVFESTDIDVLSSSEIKKSKPEPEPSTVLTAVSICAAVWSAVAPASIPFNLLWSAEVKLISERPPSPTEYVVLVSVNKAPTGTAVSTKGCATLDTLASFNRTLVFNALPCAALNASVVLVLVKVLLTVTVVSSKNALMLTSNDVASLRVNVATPVDPFNEPEAI